MPSEQMITKKGGAAPKGRKSKNPEEALPAERRGIRNWRSRGASPETTKVTDFILSLVDGAAEDKIQNFFPLSYKSLDGRDLIAQNEDDFGKWILSSAELPPLKKFLRALLRETNAANIKSTEAAPAGDVVSPLLNQGSPDGYRTGGEDQESDQSSLGAESSESVRIPRKTLPAAVIVTNSRTSAWPANAPLTVPRLQIELQQCKDNYRAGMYPKASEIFPAHVHEIVQLQLTSKIGSAAAANWLEAYNDRPIEVIEILISLLPAGGVQKDLVALLADIRLKNTPENSYCATDHAQQMIIALHEVRGAEQGKLVNLDQQTSKAVLQRLKYHFRSSEIAFFNVVGDLIFASIKYGNVPTTLWEFVQKEKDVCEAIANAIALVGKVFPKTVHLLKQGKVSSNTYTDNKGGKRKFEAVADGEKQKTIDFLCNMCGGSKSCKPGNCYFYSHPHVNRDKSKSWAESLHFETYSKKLTDGKSFSYIPMNRQAVSVGDGKYKLENWKAPENSSTDNPKKNKKPKFQVSNIAATNILNFVSGSATFNPLISARNVSNGQHLGSGILDSGAFGGHINNYVSQAMADSLLANSIASTCDCPSTKICTITGCTQSSTCISLHIELFNELGQNIIINTKARVVKGLPYGFIIGLTTIRRYKLARTFDSLFEELEGVSDLFNDEKSKINMEQSTTDKYEAVRPDVNYSANIAESAIKRPFVRPTVVSREHEVEGGLFRQLASCSRPSATLMGGNPSKSVTCKCDTKHTLWCVACSSAGSQAVEDHSTYSGEVINLLECTTITDNKASAYSQRLVMPGLVRTILTRQSLNIIHRKEDFLDIEDDTDNIDTFKGETPYDKLCSPNSTINDDSDPLQSLRIEGSNEFISKANLLVSKHASRFKTALTSEAARLTPFDLELEPSSTWYTSRQNKLPTRLQSRYKRDATREFVTNALATGLIEPSQAESWSQILLTPKANGKWRFCVDYRFLNK